MGVGDALGKNAPVPQEKLREMYTDWPWFRTNIDLIGMLLAKSEVNIAKHYEDMLAGDDAQLVDVGNDLRRALQETEQAVLDISESESLAEDNVVVQRALRLRNPYVDVLNLVQAEALQRLRDGADRDEFTDRETVREALLVTINGISTGLQNSG